MSPSAPLDRERERALGDGMEVVVKALHHGDSGRFGGLGDAPCLGLVTGEGLLGQHRLARRDGGEVPRRVQRVGQRVVDDVHLGVVDHVLVRGDDPLDAVLVGEHRGPLGIPRRHRDQSVTEFGGGPHDGRLGDPGCAEHADADAHARSRFASSLVLTT